MSLGIILGLVVGKPLGIWLFAWAGVKLRMAELPKGISLFHVASVGCLAGVGFTMSLFIATLAFDEVALVETAKTAVLAGSLLSTLIGLGHPAIAGGAPRTGRRLNPRNRTIYI